VAERTELSLDRDLHEIISFSRLQCCCQALTLEKYNARMRIRFPHLLAICFLCMTCRIYARAAMGSSPGDYEGNWVMKLGHRNFLVLELKSENDQVTGTLTRPRHFQTGDGVTFAQISSSTVTASVVRSSMEPGHFRFVVQNPANKKEEDEYEMVMIARDQALLKPVGVPFDPWPIRRMPGTQPPQPATDWDSNRAYSLEEDTDGPNVEMQRIFEADQKARQSQITLTKEDWAVIDKQDTERRNATRKLLETGQLHSDKDFAEAAFIFQHGSSCDDYLLAHSLAVVAVAKGDAGSAWIAAATLDRYLQSIGKPQIYGTQFEFTPKSGVPATQEPYNRELISDALRRQLGVPSLANQEVQLKQYNATTAKVP
jgi:hypothetical protein